jgi:hypothetical protein
MPRSAATILQLALVAFSIGFNTVRYPVVWEMLSAAGSGASGQPTAAQQQQQQEPPASVQEASPPARPIEAPPAAQVADRRGAEQSPPAAAACPNANQRAADQPDAGRPLVPVTRISAQSAPESGAADAAVIRRLPPVEQANLNSVNPQRGGLPSDTIPIYPTTGIE